MAKAKIVEIKASGAVVLLIDTKEKAWLPGVELSPQYVFSKKLSEQNLCQLEQELDVITYDRELGGKQKLVSHIRFGNDPWDKVKIWKFGYVKDMEILSVTASRAYGWLEPGIQGFVDIEDVEKIPGFKRSRKNFKTISVGDIIAGLITPDNINYRNRLVKLDIAPYLTNIEKIPEFLPIRKKDFFDVAKKQQNKKSYHNTERFLQLPPDIRSILVVDDEKLFLDEIGSYFKSCGIHVNTASGIDEAMEILEDPECANFDVALLDVNLDKSNNFLGFQVAQKVSEYQPRSHIIMTTGDNIDNEKVLQIAGDLPISSFLYKPLGLEEFNNALHDAIGNEPKKLRLFFEEQIEEDIEPEALVKTAKTGSLRSLVCDLKSDIEAEIVALFSINPISFEVQIEEYEGIGQNKAQDNLDKMRYSPVKDVAIKKEIIFEERVSQMPHYSKHLWLVKALAYESCIAYPVPLDHELEYCLFAFHGNREHFNDRDKDKVKSVAQLSAQILENQRLTETIRNENPFYLAGKTYGSMAHDLLNSLNREFGLLSIFQLLKDKTEIKADGIAELKKKLEYFQVELQRTKGIVETFRRMSRSQHEKETDVDVFETVCRAADIIRVEADALNTQITVMPFDEDIRGKTRIRQTAFEQVMYNLFLNAAQQIHRFSFIRADGNIMVELAVLHHKDEERLQILIHDSGPGIHGRDFEKVFSKGYTTKEDGCGMGLEICRTIINEAGGEIKVLKSILFCGTTFEILLPINSMEAE
jgi:signal transduction histidine kinase/DNA-binding response OmpR family regulator